MKKRVSFLIGTLSTGGAERVVSNLSMNITNDVEKDILLFGSDSSIDYPYGGKIKYLDKINHNKNFLYKLYAVFQRVLKLRKIKKDENRTIVSFLEYPNILNILSKRDEKTIISVRNHMTTKHKNGLKGFLWRLSLKYLYNRSDLIVAVSKEIKRDLIKNYSLKENRIKVIYNSYDIEMITEQSKQPLEPKWEKVFKKPVILTTGRLDMQKGQWHLIRAFSKVKHKYPDAQLVILGRGKIEKQLKMLAKEMSLENDVHFLGFQNNPFKFISKSSLFVLPSLYEGFPNALSEAMACKIPVIATDCLSGPREILAPDEFDTSASDFNYGYEKNRYGILVPTFETENFNAQDSLSREEIILSDNIELLLNSPDLRNDLSEKSFTRVKDFDIKHFVEKWQDII